MKRYIPILILLFVHTIIFGQNDSRDDNWLNPAPQKLPRRNDQNRKSSPEVKSSPKYILANYRPGHFKNIRIVPFCEVIVRKIDLEESNQHRIIKITIQGFADGIHNPGVLISKDDTNYDLCKNLIGTKEGIYDPDLAMLRACEVERCLDSMLRNKTYSTYVRLNQIAIYDIPDGGPEGGDKRKVEVTVTYQK